MGRDFEACDTKPWDSLSPSKSSIRCEESPIKVDFHLSFIFFYIFWVLYPGAVDFGKFEM